MKTGREAWSKRSRSIVGLGVLILCAILIAGCSEEKLPPEPPSDSGTVTVTGGAV